ncbi:Beta-barrel assembly machine subunit BamE [Aliiroseovarius crassostreae]|uniref:Cell envelope protein SmpA n=1 Tax=Aliiroseovarius crassostreae TaxID=154981 RepID=A0A0P7KHZ8_9RHOB|nr:outer membrane protein assembly factor BamE [Aliiroseovarius crassostreae]KPN63126.1 cell envelope protein SmpA [Aliiroseovarius crassostreae]SFU59459.1 Beta-barrel assembly machine subunit BamE [Aliiroseovarius crassostreae]
MSKLKRVGLAILLAGSVAACSATYRNHGYMPTDTDIAALQVGVDTRESVAETVGQPGTSGLLTDGGWYYVQSRFEHFTYNEPKEIDRQVLAISYDTAGKVANIERFGLEDGRVVVLDRRVTETGIVGVGFLRQMFGSLGRLNVGDIISGN